MKRIFDKHNVKYEAINCQTDLEPRPEFGNLAPVDFVIQNYTREMPVVTVEDNDDKWWFSGVRPHKIDIIVDKYSNTNN